MWQKSVEHQGLYTASYQVPGFTAQSIAIKQADENYLIYSAGCGLAKSFQEEVGSISYLLMPNQFHHLGLKEWTQHFPEAKILSAGAFADKFSKKTDLSIKDWKTVESALPETLEIVEVPGLKTGELMLKLRHKDCLTYFICDIFFNMEELPKHWLYKNLLKLMKAGPGLKISRLMTGIGMSDKKAVGKFLIKILDEEKPDIISPQHGTALKGEAGREALKSILRERLL